MLRSKLIYGLFFLAAILFVAKPFIGFKLHQTFFSAKTGNLIIAKSFTKRKPEFLNEANQQKHHIAQRLNIPVSTILITLLGFLHLLFPALLLLSLFWVPIFNSVQPKQPIYLLTGKLTI